MRQNMPDQKISRPGHLPMVFPEWKYAQNPNIDAGQELWGLNACEKHALPANLQILNWGHLLKKVFQYQPILVMIQDAELHYLYTNANSEALVRHRVLSARPPLPEDELQRLIEKQNSIKRKVLETGEDYLEEGYMADGQGRQVFARLVYSRIDIADGLHGILGVAMEVKPEDFSGHAFMRRHTAEGPLENLQVDNDQGNKGFETHPDYSSISEKLQMLKSQGETLSRTRQQNVLLNQEMTEAAELQEAMLPNTFPALDEFEISARMATSSEVGGDYYDFVEGANGNSFVAALGDATGHGVRAGIIVASVKSYFQMLGGSMPIAQVMGKISNGLKAMNLTRAYMGLGLISYQDGTFSYSSAGMPPLYIFRKESGLVEKHQIRSLFLGTHFTKPFQEINFTLQSGDIIVWVSDGFTETRNTEGHMIAESALMEIITFYAPLGGEAIVEAMQAQQAKYSDGLPLHDDATIMTIKRR